MSENGRTVATEKDVEVAISKAIKSGKAYFENVWKDAGKTGQAILTSIANGRDLLFSDDDMHLLQRHDIINDEGAFYAPIFSRWIKEFKSKTESKRGSKVIPTTLPE